jgi:hypothetical protein
VNPRPAIAAPAPAVGSVSWGHCRHAPRCLASLATKTPPRPPGFNLFQQFAPYPTLPSGAARWRGARTMRRDDGKHVNPRVYGHLTGRHSGTGVLHRVRPPVISMTAAWRQSPRRRDASGT